MALTEIQLTKLKEYVTAGDRAGYYSRLAEYGDRHAVLVLGVLRQDTV